MEPRRKSIHMRQKAHLEQKLKDRLVFLTGKGIPSRKAEKDTIARKWKADIKAINNRLRLMADHEKRSEEMSKVRAERTAAPREEAPLKKEKDGGKSEKPKKAPQEDKGKKVKAEKKAAPPKEPEAAKS